MQVPYLLSNIPSTNFKGSIFLEYLGITRCTLRLNDVILRASEPSSKMIAVSSSVSSISIFQKFGKPIIFY